MEKMPEMPESEATPEQLLQAEKAALQSADPRKAKFRLGILLASALAFAGCQKETKPEQTAPITNTLEQSQAINPPVHIEVNQNFNVAVASVTVESQPQEQTETAAAVSQQEKTVQPEVQEELSASSTWIDGIVKKAEQEKTLLKTKEDAEWFMRGTMSELTREFYFPTKGEFVETSGPYGLDIKIRKFAPGDGKHIEEQVKKIAALAKDVDTQFGSDFFGNYSAQLDDILVKNTSQSSFARMKQLELMQKMEKMLDQQ